VANLDELVTTVLLEKREILEPMVSLEHLDRRESQELVTLVLMELLVAKENLVSLELLEIMVPRANPACQAVLVVA